VQSPDVPATPVAVAEPVRSSASAVSPSGFGHPDELRLEVVPAGPQLWDRLGPVWNTLWAVDETWSAFVSPPWVGAWLSTFGEMTSAHGLVWWSGEQPVGVCFLTKRRMRRGPFPIEQLCLNGFGAAGVGCEHNRILVHPSYEARVCQGLLDYLLSQRGDEVSFDGISGTMFHQVRDRWPGRGWFGHASESPYVSLDHVRASDGGYLRLLSSNTRAQLRRSHRLLVEEFGPLALEVLEARDRAEQALATLVRLHESTWRRRGQSGAFGGDALRFHHKLFEKTFSEPSALRVDIMEVRFGDTVAGVLYNLVCQGHVQFYQSGVMRHEDNRVKPGLTCHALAIERYAEAGALTYDFLGGEPDAVRYKASMSNASQPLYWAQFPYPSFKMNLLARLRAVRSGVVRGSRTNNNRGRQTP